MYSNPSLSALLVVVQQLSEAHNHFLYIIMTRVYTSDLLISFRADELVRHGPLFIEFIRRKLHLGSCKVINLETWNNKQIMSRTVVLPLLPTWYSYNDKNSPCTIDHSPLSHVTGNE